MGAADGGVACGGLERQPGDEGSDEAEEGGEAPEEAGEGGGGKVDWQSSRAVVIPRMMRKGGFRPPLRAAPPPPE